jgi:ABC-type cobalamin/Fe3+-siderophores transport system ATPase subunit
MMDVEVTVSNYRCFSDSPVRFELKKGLQAFVGVNNSGKSSLLRFFYELRGLFAAWNNQQVVFNAMLGQPQAYGPMPLVKDPNEIFCDRNERDLVVGFEMSEGHSDAAPSPRRLEIVISRGSNTWYAKIYMDGREAVSTNNLALLNVGGGNLVATRNGVPIVAFKPVVELGVTLSRMLYLGPFRNAVNVGGSGDYYDIQIGQPFITHWKTLKTGHLKRQSEATYKLADDIRRIFGFESLDINASDDGSNLQLMIDGKSYKQSEIGSGLIQFILVLVNAAIKNPSYILIDEPELNLHPSLQVDFLTTLASYAEYGVLFATHNLGLARAVANRVYSVRKVGRDGREVRDFTGTRALAEFLGELGFNAYQDLGFETVLLVEGPTDVTCVQQLLRLYQKEHKIVLLPLGGRSMINAGCALQLEEITRVSPKVYALIDGERTQPDEAIAADRQGFVDTCSKLKIPCRVLDRRAIENYLPEHAIRSAKNSDKYRALGPYEALKAVDPAWGKEENWRIARLMTRDDLRSTDLGTFLEEL